MTSDAAAIIKEILPLPAMTDPTTAVIAHAMDEHPTNSHALAQADHAKKGAAQVNHGEEIVDLGWNEHPRDIVSPLIGGVKNEDLWVLVRRFNKQIYCLKETKTEVPGYLDLNIADEEEFSPDKLRAKLERLYMTVIVSLAGTINHVARLRSWRESRRTASFAIAYAIAWLFDCLVPVIFSCIIVLILSPKARKIMFPPAPLALVNKKTGGVQKPKAGVLASHDSITGAPENMKGEAVEQEASNFVMGIATIALASTSGKHPQGELMGEDEDRETLPDPTAFATGAAAAKEVSEGGTKDAKHDKTKVPMETTMWNQIRPVMQIIGTICDTWERIGNALTPVAPYNREIYRIRLALIIAPLALLSMFIDAQMLVKGSLFSLGFVFFGDPVITVATRYLIANFPDWPKILQPRNTLLKGVPTNAQLTITLLRVGEHQGSPLPPPPRKHKPVVDEPAHLSEKQLRAIGGEYPLNATKEELDSAFGAANGRAGGESSHPHSDDIATNQARSKHSRLGRGIVQLFRNTTRACVNAAIGTDSLRARIGSTPARNRLGVVPGAHEQVRSGPVEFKCRYKGKRGHAYIYRKAGTPHLAFSTDSKIAQLGADVDAGAMSPGHWSEQLDPARWIIDMTQIAQLRKLGGYGWKAKLVVGWALGKQVSDALEIVCRNGDEFLLTALPLRDELFNRACAIGGQKWESW